jgi:hypothetical protein
MDPNTRGNGIMARLKAGVYCSKVIRIVTKETSNWENLLEKEPYIMLMAKSIKAIGKMENPMVLVPY